MAKMRLFKAIWDFIVDIRGLVLGLAIFAVFFIEQNPLVQRLDAVFFNLCMQMATAPKVNDQTVIITLPVSSAQTLQKQPALVSELLDFLKKLKETDPIAVAFLLDGFPQGVINNDLLRVESMLSEAVANSESEADSKLLELLKLTQNLSGFGGDLARALTQNDILVGIKPSMLLPEADLFSLYNYPPYSYLAPADHFKKNHLELLPATALPDSMPDIEYSLANPHSDMKPCKVLPVYSHQQFETKRPMVWKYGNKYLPSLLTILYKHAAKAQGLEWIPHEGVQFDFHLIKTDVSGHLRPLFLSSHWHNHQVKQFALSEMAVHRNLISLQDKVVLIGAKDNSTLKDTALSLISLSSESTAYTPSWGIWLEKVIVVIFFLYLVFLLPRLKSSLVLLLSMLVVVLTATAQLGINLTQGLWIPLTTPIAFLILGHFLMHVRRQSQNRLHKVQKEADKAFFKLGNYQFEQLKYDHAFETLKRCKPSPKVMETVFNIGVEWERRLQYEKARSVFEYINILDPGYKDAAKRVANITELLGDKVKGKSDGSQTIRTPTFELKLSSLGRYEIERELGRGAMGIVYLGRDPKIGRNVAIKTLDFTQAQATEGNLNSVKERFFREAEAIGRLNHPNIVTVYDVGEEENLAFIAMDYIEGKTLQAFTEPGNLLPVHTVFKLMAQIAVALDYAHNQNVIHRDVKPGNIIYNEEKEQVKVTDFGIARFTDITHTMTKSFLGSPSFMSPEQLKRSKVDGRADIFSLGVTFFQLLTGKFPFAGEDLAGITYQITNADHPNVSSLRPDLPESAEMIINKALQKSPDKRFQTAKKMAVALKKGTPISK